MSNIKNLLKEQGYLTRKQIKKYAKENNLEYKLVLKILSDIGIKFIHIDTNNKSDLSNIEYEKCVICGKETNIKKDEKIEFRSYYVDGVGQLCYDCYQEI